MFELHGQLCIGIVIAKIATALEDASTVEVHRNEWYGIVPEAQFKCPHMEVDSVATDLNAVTCLFCGYCLV